MISSHALTFMYCTYDPFSVSFEMLYLYASYLLAFICSIYFLLLCFLDNIFKLDLQYCNIKKTSILIIMLQTMLTGCIWQRCNRPVKPLFCSLDTSTYSWEHCEYDFFWLWLYKFRICCPWPSSCLWTFLINTTIQLLHICHMGISTL